MRPHALLLRLGETLVRHLSTTSASGTEADSAAQLSQAVWQEWQQQQTEHPHAELQAILDLDEHTFREQVAQVIGEVAAGADAITRQRIAHGLTAVREVLRTSFPQPAASEEAVPLTAPPQLVNLLTASYKVPVPRITLTQTEGPLKGRQFVFELPTSTIVGRGRGCHPPFPRDDSHRSISRHHCLLEINPPDIRVRDLASTCGTYVNDELIGKRAKDRPREEAKQAQLPECSLQNGDILRLCKPGIASFEVQIFVPANCSTCGIALPEGTAEAQCILCRDNPQPRLSKRACSQCGRDVSDEVQSNRRGDFVCAQCRTELCDVDDEAPVPTIEGYAITRPLGRGGMGSVWLGKRVDTGELTALKVMLPRVAADRYAVKRFLREINITRSLRHPNLVQLCEAGYARGTFYLALEYCDGGSVDALMHKRGGTLPIVEAVEIVIQALAGLDYAHNVFGPGKGLVHRDIKPSNLFLSSSPEGRIAKIADYGLAKAFDDTGLSGATRTGELAGTPCFIPRQQVLNFKDSTADVDVWAVAASLYNMLTGRFPRNFSTGMDPWLVVLESNAVPIRKHNASIPKKLASVIDHALIEQPTIGFQTAAEFKEALQKA